MPLNSLPPLSIYIHLPWCIRKCPYCDFNSHAIPGKIPEQLYIMQLLKDFQADLHYIQEREILSIFFGGGTPSLFSAESIAIILDEIKKNVTFSKMIEITLEANPGAIEDARFKGFFQAGINRLSIGCQSFQNEKLKILGRIHDSQSAIQAIEVAKKVGFKNFNIDLMYGLPNQSVQDGLDDLKLAISLNPSHISWYQLTLEPNTFFHTHPPLLPDEDIIWEMQMQGQQLLQKHEFAQYEVSAYAKKNHYAFHNLNYWQFGDYIGIGAGAHGKISFANGQIFRTLKFKSPQHYLKTSHFMQNEEVVQTSQLPFEFMLNALRLNQPIAVELFKRRTFGSESLLQEGIKKALARDLIKLEKGLIIKTEQGNRFLNDLISCFLVSSL